MQNQSRDVAFVPTITYCKVRSASDINLITIDVSANRCWNYCPILVRKGPVICINTVGYGTCFRQTNDFLLPDGHEKRDPETVQYLYELKKRLLLRCIHHFKSDLINDIDHMRFSGTEPSSVILSKRN